MTQHSDNSFGAKLRRAQDLSALIASFTNYVPVRVQDSTANFNTFLSTLVTLNSTNVTTKEHYKEAVSLRHAAYKTNSLSVVKLIAQIKAFTEALYGKKSVEAIGVAEIVRKMRRTKVIHIKISNFADPSLEAMERTISQSVQSYGAQFQYFNDLISHIGEFTGYNPSNTNLKITELKKFALSLNALNNGVIVHFHSYKLAVINRREGYDELAERQQRIKLAVKAQYGVDSKEFNLIKGI